jgi:hypothetical protein
MNRIGKVVEGMDEVASTAEDLQPHHLKKHLWQ